MSYLRSYLRYWKKFFSFQLPLNSSFKNGVKKERFKSIKFTYEWRGNVIIWHFGAILYAGLIGHPLSPTTTPAGSIQIFTLVAFNQFCLHGRRLSIPWSLPDIPLLSVVFSIGQSELDAGTQRTIHKLTIYFSRSEWSQYRLSLSRCQSLNYPILQRFW